MDIVWIWTIIIVVALVIEFFTMELISVWCAIGGLLGLILAACDVPIEIQIICAVVVAIVCILGLRRFAMKYLFKNSKNKEAEPLVGKKLKLLENCDDEKLGTAKLNGVIWSVFSDKPINAGQEVEIVSVNGNKLKVKEISAISNHQENVNIQEKSETNNKNDVSNKSELIKNDNKIDDTYNQSSTSTSNHSNDKKTNVIKRKSKPKSEN